MSVDYNTIFKRNIHYMEILFKKKRTNYFDKSQKMFIILLQILSWSFVNHLKSNFTF